MIKKYTEMLSLIILLSGWGAAWADGPVVQTPPLGYNSFDSYNCCLYEEVAMKEIDAFIEKFSPHGYEYFVIDNGWFSSPESTNFNGYLVPIENKARAEHVTVNEFGIVQPSELYFSNGFKPLVDKLQANGLKFGVHLMRGIPKVAVERDLPIKGTDYTARDIYTTKEDCVWCDYMHGVDMTRPGAQEFYNSVFDQFAAWGIDFVKVDDVTHHPAEIEAYVKAIEQCGRPMVLSLSAGNTSNVKYIDTYRKTNMVRTTPDIWDNQESLDRSFNSMRKWQGLERPGFWPDLDMIPFGELCILSRKEIQKRPLKKTEAQFLGHMHHWCFFSENQKETFITQRAISASPIMIGGSMISLDEHSYQLLTHKEMLACVKNGVHGKLVHEENGVELWNAPVANRDRFGYQEYTSTEGWMALFNRTDEEQTVQFDWRYLRFLPKGKVYDFEDMWGSQSLEGYKRGHKLSFTVEPQGVVFMKYTEHQR
ncbi:Alpha-galactosidase A [Pontiella desulfatans]|uniref:Alpha-galactosidase A n=1 Tax=Pontiella desulfatans TaxID=2750659 RepID=A0A6C2U4H5_PONDE|nr:glycoside hydrolase family 27 protein [Pontiella desulfatans]VGO14880.1 Alpha-galactosidase A [Pontiella desulfatans]